MTKKTLHIKELRLVRPGVLLWRVKVDGGGMFQLTLPQVGMATWVALNGGEYLTEPGRYLDFTVAVNWPLKARWVYEQPDGSWSAEKPRGTTVRRNRGRVERFYHQLLLAMANWGRS